MIELNDINISEPSFRYANLGSSWKDLCEPAKVTYEVHSSFVCQRSLGLFPYKRLCSRLRRGVCRQRTMGRAALLSVRVMAGNTVQVLTVALFKVG
ncbi:hypothetical protein J6590_053712 [Homalodisca vitripennis]|nr:hypothetical protein J6590_053712 [Homalodisca vitripennis]